MIKQRLRNLFLKTPRTCFSRFPLALAASLAAAIAAVLINHDSDLHFSDAVEGRLVRVLLVWPFALFGNVAWTLRCGFRGGARTPGLLVLAAAVIAGWFLLPAQAQTAGDGFWIAYGFAAAAWLFGACAVSSTRRDDPPLWEAAWSITLAGFMATLSAMVLAGGINAALFSMEKLFGLNVDGNWYFDVVQIGFFLAAPITAFLWLPHPFGMARTQPGWMQGAVRLILIPLCALYALILFSYIAKIAVTARWPDGWVSMPTLVFAAIGLIAYLIVRAGADETGGRRAVLFRRLFPALLVPLALVLLLAMRVRVQEYGFTAWRVAGCYLGVWILGFGLLYSMRPSTATWWIAASLAALLAVAAAGPASLNAVALRSQQARVEGILDRLGVWERDAGDRVLEVSGRDGADLKSALQYLLAAQHLRGLPPRVAERWNEHRRKNTDEKLPERTWQWRREADSVLTALGICITNPDGRYFTVRCNGEPLPLEGASSMYIIKPYSSGEALFSMKNGIELLADGRPVATREIEAFARALDDRQRQSGENTLVLPPEQMTVRFAHDGKNYRAIFMELTHNGRREVPEHQQFQNWSGITVILEE